MAQITYLNKSALNENQEVADINKINASDINEIKSVVNENDSNVGDLTNLSTSTKSSIVGAINELKDAGIYSTTEAKTSKVWINGKPIYRRVFSIGTIAVGGSSTVGTISNLDTVVDFSGAFYDNGLWFPIARVHRSNVIYQTQVYITGSNLTVANGSSSRVESGYIILEYTKTTD